MQAVDQEHARELNRTAQVHRRMTCARPEPITLDLADIKSQTLGISDDPIEKLRNMLIIRACEFLNFDALQKDLDIKRVTEVTKKSAYFSNVQVLKALYRYEILNNSLKTEEDKKKF